MANKTLLRESCGSTASQPHDALDFCAISGKLHRDREDAGMFRFVAGL